MTVRGKIVHVPLSGGVYMLETAEGQRYALKGGDEGLRKAGQAVKVEGKVATGMGVGIGMTGDPVLEVEGYSIDD